MGIGTETVVLGGKEKRLRYDFNAISDIEVHFGKGISAIFNEEQIGFNTIRVFYWGGLKWKDPGLTIERTGNLLFEKFQEYDGEEEAFEALMKPIFKALNKSGLMKGLPEMEDDEKN